MTVLIVLTGVLLGAAACLSLWRMVAGPTPLDRIISSDVIVAIAIAAVGLYSVIAGNSTGLPILLGLSLVGFTGAVGVARLIASSAGVRRLFDQRRAMDTEDADES